MERKVTEDASLELIDELLAQRLRVLIASKELEDVLLTPIGPLQVLDRELAQPRALPPIFKSQLPSSECFMPNRTSSSSLHLSSRLIYFCFQDNVNKKILKNQEPNEARPKTLPDARYLMSKNQKGKMRMKV